MANLRADNLTGTGGRNAIDGSVCFDGLSYLICSTSSDFELPGDFTIEMWWKKTKYALYHTLFDTKTSNGTDGMECFIASNGSIQLYGGNGGGSYAEFSAVSALTDGAWHHIAITRSSNVHRVFVNGIVGSTTFSASTTYISQTNRPVIGSDGTTLNTNVPNGYISNFRIVKGTALYTANFTPPTEKLTAIDGTVLLCCQDSDNSTQEATGKTITGYGNLQTFDDTELVTNGGFAADLSGWTTSGVQWTHSNSAMMHFGNGNTQRNAYQNVTTVVGKRYVARVMASSAEASTAYWQIAGSTINYVADNNNSAQLEYKHYFTATSTSTQIRFYSYDSGNSSNVRSYWYNASIKLAPQGKAPKVLPPVGVDAGVVFDGDIKMNSQGVMYFPTGDTSQRGRGRALFGGGYLTPSGYDGGISYLEMQSSGNTVDFGDLSLDRGIPASTASSTRGIWSGGGIPGGVTDRIDYVTIATTGDAIDFGNNFQARKYFGGCGSQTRGVFGGGDTAPGAAQVDTIDYITIATKGDAEDFGNLTSARQHVGACSSPTRGVWAGGGTPTRVKTIDYITIATIGHAEPFGDLTVTTMSIDGLSSNTRGLFAAGTTPTMVKTIDYITISSLGDAKDFGDLITVNSHYACTSNGIKGIWAGGYDGSGEGYNLIEYVTIATTGNAQDWGDTYRNRKYHAGCSDSHGGLS